MNVTTFIFRLTYSMIFLLAFVYVALPLNFFPSSTGFLIYFGNPFFRAVCSSLHRFKVVLLLLLFFFSFCIFAFFHFVFFSLLFLQLNDCKAKRKRINKYLPPKKVEKLMFILFHITDIKTEKNSDRIILELKSKWTIRNERLLRFSVAWWAELVSGGKRKAIKLLWAKTSSHRVAMYQLSWKKTRHTEHTEFLLCHHENTTFCVLAMLFDLFQFPLLFCVH